MPLREISVIGGWGGLTSDDARHRSNKQIQTARPMCRTVRAAAPCREKNELFPMWDQNSTLQLWADVSHFLRLENGFYKIKKILPL